MISERSDNNGWIFWILGVLALNGFLDSCAYDKFSDLQDRVEAIETAPKPVTGEI